MSIVQWLLLILVIVVVAGAYWYIRRYSGGDPWQGMDDPVEGDDTLDHGQAPGGDSYVVGVRTVARETPAQRKAATEAKQAERAEREARVEEAVPGPGSRSFRRARSESETEQDPAAAPQAPSADVEPAISSAETDVDATSEVAPAEPAAPHDRVEMRAPRQTAGEQEIFILNVASPDGRFFDGPDVHAALADADLKFGLNDIYHRVTEVHGVTESVFAVANMLKPGTLDPIDQDHLSTPGLTMFLMVPGPLEGRPAMHDMMETANRLAGALGGEVLDDKRALLKAQTAQYMLDQIADIDRRAKLARKR